ncbi:MAG: hypothetical protein DRP63_04800 [Planctomycetota bacterium]|nr:MAG: hypothetical protein DRP63_04800 [Planctomycetota bacterium]
MSAKQLVLLLALVAVGFVASGCATIVHYERCFLPPEERGSIDAGMLVWNILSNFGLGLIVDFLTGAIYVPKFYQQGGMR